MELVKTQVVGHDVRTVGTEIMLHGVTTCSFDFMKWKTVVKLSGKV